MRLVHGDAHSGSAPWRLRHVEWCWTVPGQYGFSGIGPARGARGRPNRLRGSRSWLLWGETNVEYEETTDIGSYCWLPQVLHQRAPRTASPCLGFEIGRASCRDRVAIISSYMQRV